MFSDDAVRKKNSVIEKSALPCLPSQPLPGAALTALAVDSHCPRTEFTQTAFSVLYGDQDWICVRQVLYKWEGTYYQIQDDDAERRRIAEFLNNLPRYSKSGTVSYPHARSSKVEEVLRWVKYRLYVSPERVNPPGLNCTNGVLKLSWQEQEPLWELVSHDPDMYYLYQPLATYDPEADDSNCATLLGCLTTEQQDIFLKTIGASLDISTIRRFKGRKVRALLMKGTGSNGKDALRKVTDMLYGHVGLTSCSLADFAMYDQGRKFPLARLAFSRINWSSENATLASLDKVQSLKAFITGDNIICEKKGKDEYEFEPKAIGIFNINENPNILAAGEAISSRYALLSFEKVYSDRPKPGEILADPRFKYDTQFLQTQVLPAFLNRVLESLVKLMTEDIDYSSTLDALEEAQEEACHLYRFVKDTGLSYGDDVLTAADIWERLRHWYIQNGTLSVEPVMHSKEKHTWVEQARQSDKNVKGVNQVIPRILELFPKAKRTSKVNPSTRHKQVALSGITFCPPQRLDEKVERATEKK